MDVWGGGPVLGVGTVRYSGWGGPVLGVGTRLRRGNNAADDKSWDKKRKEKKRDCNFISKIVYTEKLRISLY